MILDVFDVVKSCEFTVRRMIRIITPQEISFLGIMSKSKITTYNLNIETFSTSIWSIIYKENKFSVIIKFNRKFTFGNS